MAKQRTTGNEFGVALRKARDAKEVRLYELSQQLDVSVPFLSDVENGRRTLSDARIRIAARYLGVDPLPLLEMAVKDRGKIVLDTSHLTKKQLRAAMLLSANWPHIDKLLSNLKEFA